MGMQILTTVEKLLATFGARPLLIDGDRVESSMRPRCDYAITEDGIAVIDCVGVLGNNPDVFDYWAGYTRYSQISAEMEDAATDPAVKGIILRCDSPGGDTTLAFETADEVNGIVKASDKPIWCSVDAGAYSAAYLLASQTSRIYTPPKSGGVGSIGVYTAHVDYSQMMQKAGVKITFISEGEGKVDGNPFEPLSDSARADFKSEVAVAYGHFVNAVGRGRTISADAIKAMGAKTKGGPDAIAAGLADRLGTFKDCLAEMRAEIGGTSASISFAGARAAGESQKGEPMSESNQNPAPPVDEADVRARAKEAARADITEIVELCSLAKVDDAKALGFIKAGKSPADVRAALSEERVKAEEQTRIGSSILPGAATGDKPAQSLADRMRQLIKGDK